MKIVLGTVIYICSDETLLFFNCGVVFSIACPGHWSRCMVIVTPFCKVICEFQTRCIGACVFEIDDDKLFVMVRRKEERGRCRSSGGGFGY